MKRVKGGVRDGLSKTVIDPIGGRPVKKVTLKRPDLDQPEPHRGRHPLGDGHDGSAVTVYEEWSEYVDSRLDIPEGKTRLWIGGEGFLFFR